MRSPAPSDADNEPEATQTDEPEEDDLLSVTGVAEQCQQDCPEMEEDDGFDRSDLTDEMLEQAIIQALQAVTELSAHERFTVYELVKEILETLL